MASCRPSRSCRSRSLLTIKATRSFLVSELQMLIRDLSERPIPEGAFGKFSVNLTVQVQEGKVANVKSSAYFERSETVGVTR